VKRTTIKKMDKISSRSFIILCLFGIFGAVWLIALGAKEPETVSELLLYCWPFIIAVFFLILSISMMFISLIASSLKNISLMSKGIEARAEILSVRESGTRINENPVLDFRLKVYPENMTPFTSEAQQTISILNIPKYSKGSFVRVKYNPVDMESAIIGTEK